MSFSLNRTLDVLASILIVILTARHRRGHRRAARLASSNRIPSTSSGDLNERLVRPYP
jgi:hypothetical protein